MLAMPVGFAGDTVSREAHNSIGQKHDDPGFFGLIERDHVDAVAALEGVTELRLAAHVEQRLFDLRFLNHYATASSLSLSDSRKLCNGLCSTGNVSTSKALLASSRSAQNSCSQIPKSSAR